jgi:hypothetical protein
VTAKCNSTVLHAVLYRCCSSRARNFLLVAAIFQLFFINITGEAGPDAKRALELVQRSVMINNDWQNLVDHFDFLRNREAQHAMLSSQILSRVMGWTLLEAALVVTMAIGQVMYWKKLFEQRRYL